MALITLKSRKDPFEVPNEKARSIKARWGGLDAPKASPDDIVDLEWVTFQYGQIKSIEITRERKIVEEDYYRPLTPEEKAANAKVMARIREKLEEKGVLKQINKMEAKGRCDCGCLLAREYVCRHSCEKCSDSNPL